MTNLSVRWGMGDFKKWGVLIMGGSDTPLWTMLHMRKRIISPHVFLDFPQILIFRVISGVKKCLSYSVSQEEYILWLWFLVCKSKMMTSTEACYIFSKFWLSLLLGRGGGSAVKGQKMAQNDKNFCQSYLVSQEWYLIWLWFLVHICKIISPAIFSIFSKFWFWVFRVKMSKNDP